MILEHDGKRLNIAASARIARNAVVCGEVVIGENCSIGFRAVIIAESDANAIGANVIAMDTAVLHGIENAPLTIGDNVLIGLHAAKSGKSSVCLILPGPRWAPSGQPRENP